MRLRATVLGMVMGMALAAGAAPTVIFDRGLHRAWRVERDALHPERPARLVEVPWSTGPTGEQASPGAKRAAPQPPSVRAGMQVTVIRQGAMAEIRLEGTALRTAGTGEIVPVRAGLGHSIVSGIVRGPGVVELCAEKTR